MIEVDVEMQIRKWQEWISDPRNHAVFKGVPSFFRALCAQARRGGRASYANVGREFASALLGLEPWTVSSEEWEQFVQELVNHLDGDRDDRALEWFLRHYPACMYLVPETRRGKFVDGVRSAHEGGQIIL